MLFKSLCKTDSPRKIKGTLNDVGMTQNSQSNKITCKPQEQSVEKIRGYKFFQGRPEEFFSGKLTDIQL